MPVRVRLVDDGRKEIHRLDEGLLVVEAIDRGVSGRGETDEQIGIIRCLELLGEWTQDLRQFGGADLGCSARAGRVFS